ncbi:hypothetical protein [Marihabitans asiaticum]|uniref:Uncharacterized protein n=1 Tax=Marihabitans asiaticum TaxID=415218 RepID=A0A560WFS0_9MICO|nr:hypothetical protein [Marihabitans asiaticum]TWD16542.1 hypothetical protein FB557_0065 [Marihabitans asiaticum]
MVCGDLLRSCYEVDAVIEGLEPGSYDVRCEVAVLGVLVMSRTSAVELGVDPSTVPTGCVADPTLDPVIEVQVRRADVVVASSGRVRW